MTISTDQIEGDITSVLLDGRLDIEGAAVIDLRMNVIAGSTKNLLVDLQNVSFLGSMGASLNSGSSAGRFVAEEAKRKQIDDRVPRLRPIRPRMPPKDV